MAAINARYEIVRLLGTGSSGEVYLAFDFLHDGLPVAIKRVPAGSMSEPVYQEVRHEFFVLSGLDHPNLAKVFDLGVCESEVPPFHPGDYFSVREYVNGRPIFPSGPERSWNDICETAYQLACTIDYVHRHGLIHFDIKPENILVSTGMINGEEVVTVRLIDFGFAFNPDQSTAPVRGTLDYLAPELIGRSGFDHRVDLYSLGITLYQLATGHLPFENMPPLESLKRRQSEPPPSLSAVRSDTPAEFAAMVSRLCEPDPNRRPARGMDAARILEPILPRRELFREYYRRIRPHIMVGRREEFERLQNALSLSGEDASRSQLGAVQNPLFVVGPSGIGKTRLLEELQRVARAKGWIVLRASCASASSRPLVSLLPAIKELAYSSHTPLRQRRELPLSGEHLIETLLPVLRTQNDPGRAMPAERFARRLAEEVLWFFHNCIVTRQTILWIDDADVADAATIAVCRELSSATAAARPFLVLTAESEDLVHAQFGTPRVDPASIIRLTELSAGEVAEFIRQFLDVDSVPPSVANQMVNSVGGNPLVLSEFLSPLTGSNDIALLTTALGDVVSSSTIRGLLPLYERRFAAFAPEDRRLLDVLSCFRSEVEVEILAQLVPIPGAILRQVLLKLVNTDVIATGDHLRTVRFSQSRFQQYVHERIGRDRASTHARLAAVLEQMYFGQLDEHAADIAYHFDEAGQRHKAHQYYRRAAAMEERRSAHRESARFLQKALDLATTVDERVSVLEQLAEAYRLAADYAQAQTAYRELLGLPNLARERRMTLLRTLGSIQTMLGEVEAAGESFQSAARFAETPNERLGIELEVAALDIATAHFQAARTRLEHLKQTLPSDANPENVLDLFNKLGIVSFHEARFGEALQLFLEALRMAESVGKLDKMISPLLNLGNVHSAQGAYDEAQQYWERALTLTKKVGNMNLEARILNNLGITQYVREQFSEAFRNYQNALQLFDRLGNRPGKSLCMTNLGEVQFALADYEHALYTWEDALRLFEELQDAQGVAEVSIDLAHVHLMLGDTETARQELESAHRVMKTNGITAVNGPFENVRASLLTLRGEHEQALASSLAACQTFRATSDWWNLANALVTRGWILKRLDRPTEAGHVFQEASDVAKQRGFRILHAEALLGLSAIAGDQRVAGLSHALDYLREALADVENTATVETTWKVFLMLAEAYYRRGLHKKAQAHIARAQQALEQLSSAFRSDVLRGQFLSSHGRSLPPSLPTQTN